MTYLQLHHVTGVEVSVKDDPVLIHLDVEGEQEIDITFYFDTEEDKKNFISSIKSMRKED
jgi:hypothetical protein